VLDDAGQRSICAWQGPVASVGETGNIPAEALDIVAVSEEGRTLVLLKAGAESATHRGPARAGRGDRGPALRPTGVFENVASHPRRSPRARGSSDRTAALRCA